MALSFSEVKTVGAQVPSRSICAHAGLTVCLSCLQRPQRLTG